MMVCNSKEELIIESSVDDSKKVSLPMLHWYHESVFGRALEEWPWLSINGVSIRHVGCSSCFKRFIDNSFHICIPPFS
jgi:hypothetical protein